MKYLWEIALAAKEENISMKSLRFVHTQDSSPYMELSLPCINQNEILGEREVGVNTYYRFYSIFKNMFCPEMKEAQEIRNSLTNLILHMLAENDVRKGMTKEEYYKKMLIADIEKEVFGKAAKEVFGAMEKQKQERLLSGWLRSYKVGSSLSIFIDMIHGLVDDSIVYHNNDFPEELLIYTRHKKTEILEQRMQFLIDLFLDIKYHVEVYYECHFGIIGVEETMKIDVIAIY